MRILYVEDNPANVFLVKRVAKMGQHEIINFIDGREAIRKFDEVDPDLVLMDIQLVGETSGLEVVKELRGRGVQTPIIAVTAYAMVGDKERCIEAGCNDYLAKPLPIPRLIEIFQTYEVTAKKIRDTQTQRAIAEAAKAEQAKAEDEQASAASTEKGEAVDETKAEAALGKRAKPKPGAKAETKSAPVAKAETKPESAVSKKQADVPATRRLPEADIAQEVMEQPVTASQDDTTGDDSTQPTKPEVVAKDTASDDDVVATNKPDTSTKDATADNNKVEPSAT